MRRHLKQIVNAMLIIAIAVVLLIACSNNQNNNQANNPVSLTILATSDMHDYLMNYDYYTTTETDSHGLVKLATLIKQYQGQNEAEDIVLVDNGDLIQGNPLGDFFARIEPIQKGELHPIYRAFEYLGYDAAGIGNHEFNYGLDYLHQIINDTTVPVINANVYNTSTRANEFRPYVIVPKICQDTSGNTQEVKVGIISFVPTQILNWDKLHLEGKVTVQDIRACAETFIPVMKEEGADIIVALAHTGYGNGEDYVEGAENMAYHLTLIDGIDVVIGGHSHESFPSDTFIADTGLQKVDLEIGTINGTFTVQPTKYAEGLGVVSLSLTPAESGYEITDGKAQVVSVEGVESDIGLVGLLAPYHEQVINYVEGPISELDSPLNSFFALIGDDASVQLVSDAQLAYAEQAVQDAPELADYRELPLLSAAAPFEAGLSKSGTNPDNYVNINQGSIAIKDVASLYKYPNTVTILKVTGKEIREWLEMSAGIYNTIDATTIEPQPLLRTDFLTFNFDTIDGVSYEFDITQPPRYDTDGTLINKDAHRVINLQFDGANIKDDQEFLVVTNNYRGGGGGNFPIFGEDSTPIVYSSSDETRQVIADYITSQGTVMIKADQNWRIAPIDAEVYTVFESNSEGATFLKNYPSIKVGKDLGNGITEYIYNL